MKNKYSIRTHTFPVLIILAAFLAVLASACSPQPTVAQGDAVESDAEAVAVEAVSEEPTEEPTVVPPTATFAPTFTAVPSSVSTEVVEETGDSASDTASESAAQPPVIGGSSLTTLSNVNVRACPAVTCDIVGSFGGGATVNGLEMVEGAAYGDSVWWWRVELSGGSGYVHTAFVK